VLAPAVGYRVTAGSSHIFYVPDVARLPNPVVLFGISICMLVMAQRSTVRDSTAWLRAHRTRHGRDTTRVV
jgi:hypothetical protein